MQICTYLYNQVFLFSFPGIKLTITVKKFFLVEKYTRGHVLESLTTVFFVIFEKP